MRGQYRSRRVAVIGIERKPMTLCPYCGEVLEGVTGTEVGSLTAPKIQPGNYALCYSCREIMRYDGPGFSKVTPEEEARVLEETPLMKSFRESIRGYAPPVDPTRKVQ
jgi:uncharacterized protein with PIN domain